MFFVILGLKKYFAVRVANLTATKGLGLRGWEDGFMDADGNPFPLNEMMNDDVSANPWDNIWEWGASQRAYRFANAGYKVYLYVHISKKIERTVINFILDVSLNVCFFFVFKRTIPLKKNNMFSLKSC